MRMRRLALAGAAALLLAGCGGSDESASDSSAAASSSSESGSELSRMEAAEVVDASFTALEESGAARVVGSIEENGSLQELDLQLQGDDVSGSITMDGVAVQLISVGGQAYVQAPADFWSSFGMPAEFAGQLEGQWVLMPPEAAESFASLTLSGLVAELRSAGGDSVKGEVTTDELEGEEVVVVTQEDGSTFTARDDDAEPFPLLIEDKGDAPATVEFSGFGEPTEITAPPNPFDLNTLGG
ncbi:hypothetical protein DQ244_07610 [Blastococcus sp. TBT05-19]|nr:hypothetical protein DQ244_07610 [Blastococcus sp. TBT05-19]